MSCAAFPLNKKKISYFFSREEGVPGISHLITHTSEWRRCLTSWSTHVF